MIKEALEFLANLKAGSMNPQLVHETRLQRTMRVGGEIKVFDRDRPARTHKVETLNDLIALANRFKGEGDTPVVWYNQHEINLVMNDGRHRDDVAVLRLARSELFTAIASLDPKRWYDPRSFVRLLRVELNGALDSQTLLDPVRRVRFDNGVTTTMEKTRVRESMGREVTSAVKTDVEIPEYVMLRASVYMTPGAGAEVSIRAAVEVDPAQGLFQLAVLPDEIQEAVSSTLEDIGGSLATQLNEGIPCYQGSPA